MRVGTDRDRDGNQRRPRLIQSMQYQIEFFTLKIGNNSSVGITGFISYMNKKIQQQNATEVSIGLGPQPFGSDALLSELLRYVLLGRSKIFIESYTIGSS